MKRLEVSGAVRPIYGSLGFRRLICYVSYLLGLLSKHSASTAWVGIRKQYSIKLLMMSQNCDETFRVKYAYDRLCVDIFI